jgi:hypothetical protein
MRSSWRGAGTVLTISSKRGQRLIGPVRGPADDAAARVGVKHGKVELLLARVEVDEQVVHLVQDLLGAGVGAVDLVDHHDRASPASRAFLRTKRVWGRALGRVHESMTPSTILSVRSTSPPKSRGRGCRRC